MRILVANDDGIDAPGLAFLEAVAWTLSNDVWVVAPDGKRSGAGNSLTLHRPFSLERQGDKRFACTGTPADGIVGAMTGLFREDAKPDLVLSGVNDGRNAAEDIAYSGTIGIAREATFWNVPAIAFSRTKGIAPVSSADIAFLSGLVAFYVERRALWAKEGHWLSFNLPKELPAPVRAARIGRDKIAHRAEILEDSAERLTLRTSSAREHKSTQGDENDIIARGGIAMLWLNWFGHASPADDLIPR